MTQVLSLGLRFGERAESSVINKDLVLDVQVVQGVPCVNTGVICKYLGLIINKDFITETLKVPPHAKVGIAGLWTVDQLAIICQRMREHLKKKESDLRS